MPPQQVRFLENKSTLHLKEVRKVCPSAYIPDTGRWKKLKAFFELSSPCIRECPVGWFYEKVRYFLYLVVKSSLHVCGESLVSSDDVQMLVGSSRDGHDGYVSVFPAAAVAPSGGTRGQPHPDATSRPQSPQRTFCTGGRAACGARGPLPCGHTPRERQDKHIDREASPTKTASPRCADRRQRLQSPV